MKNNFGLSDQLRIPKGYMMLSNTRRVPKGWKIREDLAEKAKEEWKNMQVSGSGHGDNCLMVFYIPGSKEGVFIAEKIN